MHEDSTLRGIYAHAEEEYPKECCGIVTAGGVVVRLENTASNPYQSFCLSAKDYLKYAGGALFAYHSHPDRPAVASVADLRWQDQHRLPLMVVSWPQGEVRLIGNPGRNTPLEGRSFIYGVYDCYSLVQDYYSRELAYLLPTITRPRFGWWGNGELDLFSEGVASSGLVDANTPEPGDVLLFQVNGAKVPNHIGVYVGNDMLLHHGLLSLSTLSPYDEDFRNATTRILRRAD